MIGAVNFNGKFEGIPLKANSINENLIEIFVDKTLISFIKGKKNAVKKELQSIFHKKFKEIYKKFPHEYIESDQKKNNIKINKFVDSLDLEFKNMAPKKVAPKNLISKKEYIIEKPISAKNRKLIEYWTGKKVVLQKKSAPVKKSTPKKVAVKKVIAPRKKIVSTNISKDRYIQALPLGKRISKEGNVYYENRLNHADVKQKAKYGKMLGINEDFFDTTVIKDIDDLRKQYFKLAQKYHPDKGGTTSQMQQLNAEHKRLLDKLLKGSKLSEEDQKNEIDIDDAMKVIIDNIINIQNINIEVVGKWLWVSSDTFGFTTPTYNALNSAGLKYIKKQGRPYMIYAGVQSTSRGKMSKSDIDAKYGKTTFTPKKPSSINGVITNKTKLLSALKKLKKALDNRPV